MKVTKHLIARGIVQGVGFREPMRYEAARLGVTGWVRNCRDGAVEAMLHGPTDGVAKMLDWVHRGPPGASVAGVEVSDASDTFETFERLPTA